VDERRKNEMERVSEREKRKAEWFIRNEDGERAATVVVKEEEGKCVYGAYQQEYHELLSIFVKCSTMPRE
jgi:hypothetical protein